MTTEYTNPPALIGLDWGTSSLRAYLFDETGAVLDSRHSPNGIMRLPKPHEMGGFDEIFEALCGDWLNSRALPVIASGMIGAARKVGRRRPTSRYPPTAHHWAARSRPSRHRAARRCISCQASSSGARCRT